MSVTLNPENPSPAIRNTDFNFTVNVSAPGDITSIDVVLTGEPEPINISIASSSFTVSGQYLTGFTDTLTYVSEGSSDLIEDPTSVVGIENMPADKALFDLDQDRKQSLTRSYTVTVKYTDDETMSTATSQSTLNHVVLNDLEGIRSFMANYF